MTFETFFYESLTENSMLWNIQTDVQPLKIIYNTRTLEFQSEMEYQVKFSIL